MSNYKLILTRFEPQARNFDINLQNPIGIHGDRDRLFPMNGFEVDFTIKGGGHFMFVDRRKEVLSKIKAAIEKKIPQN